MGSLKITAINRNTGATSQQYRIEYRKQGDPVWIAGPTLSYDQAVTAMPLLIPIPDTWLTFNAEVRIVTVCGTTNLNGNPILILIEEEDCDSEIVVTGNQFHYGFTELDTTGEVPPEVDYVTSVDDVFTANEQQTGTFVPGGNVQVNDFENEGDKVMFMQLPAAELPFTKWSEIGNPFQQNLLIDQTFGTGTSTWFKTQRAGETLYMTRYQTSFVGAILFSR